MSYMQLKPTMRYAKQSGGANVVVKKLRPDSNELSILQHLHSFAPSHNYVLPILTALELDVGMFIFVPEGTPLELGFTFKMFSNKGADFSRQLIEGVAFLHRCDIAHLDLKPANLVVLKNRLLIIDFDISVRVDGPDTLIDHWCGTPGWMAPEIGHKDGPVCLYSPIRADLWPCGRMLEYLAKKGVVQDNWFKTLTKRLLNKNPRLRPLLGVQSSVTVADPSSDGNGRLKRKLDALPHDVKRLAVLTGP
jgi:serine/threonine protein kinase